MAYGHCLVCTDRGGRHVPGFRPGRRSMADIRFGPADYGGMSGRRSDFSQGQKH